MAQDIAKAQKYLASWRNDWNMFVRDVLKANLDKEQQAIIASVQHNPMTACEKYHWTYDYVVWGISYTNLG